MDYYDYQSVADEAGIPADKLAELVRLVHAEYPHDPMMCELHILRACLAIRDHRITLEEALAKPPAVAV
jgi:hypothetical protein